MGVFTLRLLLKLASLLLIILAFLVIGILAGAALGYPNAGAAIGLAIGISSSIGSVSYTHLMLPTNREV